MKQGITILIADRNPHVREFLRRELTTEGYRVQLVKNGKELLSWLDGTAAIDLLVLDLDLPFTGDCGMLDEVRSRTPELPIVVHTNLPEYISHPTSLMNAVLVEKKGNSVDRLKDVISDVFNTPPSPIPRTPLINGPDSSHH
ncbi:MAG: response regulator [Desulfatiglandales bacterium]